MNSLKHFKICAFALLLTLLSNTVHAQISNDISHEEALKVLLTAKKEAEKLGVLENIAVIDACANLKAFIRMDGSFLGSIDIAIKKAKTARYFNMATGDLGKISQPGGIVYNIELSNGGLITFPGGVPIKDENGTIIGAIGVSGGTIEEDHDIATVGANAILQ
ncbi:GlcG/HbpS family heme-binding protein [Thalassobellus suaedae]|uniref:Heme-binding protein n=1 Tax=Thalassobellus suaedae TaxID=3074124 RepID=A0ABY9Y148_9FLAO|nr:heme-binding protein [Flavobacteriaceae bacterium HL-DH10]